MLMPQPGVFLELAAGRDLAAALRNALKSAGQQVGVVIGALELHTNDTNNGFLVRAQFATPTPALAAEMARYVVAGLQARERGDGEWDGDDLLWQLQRRRRSEAVPIPTVQLLAEARRRNLPAFVRADGLIQLGQGARGQAFERECLAEQVPWARLGEIPIHVLSGVLDEQVGQQRLNQLREQGLEAKLAYADFAQARALLCEPSLQAAVIALDPASLLARGLPFDRCASCDLGDLPTSLPDARSADEIARAVALPLLITAPEGSATVHGAPSALARYLNLAACRVEMAAK
ncbi:MAG: DUF4938 domain-containing protein [Roseiflexaceae bacterium]|nr:DUF4938 domain-containing protein [Roseiflexaceae bacterium]